MKVLLIGLPYFAKKIALNLSEVDQDNIYISLDTSGSLIDRVKYFFLLPFCGVVYQIGGTVSPGGALRLALFFKKRIIFHWVGTDVLVAKEKVLNKQASIVFLSQVVHMCEVEWIQKELKEISIDAPIVQIASFDLNLISARLLELPSRFIVLSYVGTGREHFYGLGKIFQLARQMPYIDFRIAGIDSFTETTPNNVKLLGWVKDMDVEYQGCSLYLRLPEHDGLAFSVLEALSYGRHVGYSQAFESTNHVPDFNSLQRLVASLYEDHTLGRLKINQKGFELIVKNYSRKKCMKILISAFKDEWH